MKTVLSNREITSRALTGIASITRESAAAGTAPGAGYHDRSVAEEGAHAAAVSYDFDRDKAPWVAASARLKLADVMRHIAIRHGVPIEVNPGLARELSQYEVGSSISDNLYATVAEIFRRIPR